MSTWPKKEGRLDTRLIKSQKQTRPVFRPTLFPTLILRGLPSVSTSSMLINDPLPRRVVDLGAHPACPCQILLSWLVAVP